VAITAEMPENKELDRNLPEDRKTKRFRSSGATDTLVWTKERSSVGASASWGVK
jgi:hypothetical protein